MLTSVSSIKGMPREKKKRKRKGIGQVPKKPLPIRGWEWKIVEKLKKKRTGIYKKSVPVANIQKKCRIHAERYQRR